MATGVLARTGLRDLVALTKPRITLMVLITTAGGVWLAPVGLTLPVLLATLIGTSLVVSSASTLNMWLEREIDARMARTRNRPLPAGRLDPEPALVFGLSLGALGVPLLAVAVNTISALLAVIALILYVCVYTPMKQRTSIALLVGAVPGAMPPLIGWTAATGSIDLGGILLFLILFFWQIPHFLAISLVRKEDYARAGLQLLPLETTEHATRLQIVLYLGALIPVTLLLFAVRVAGVPYLVAAVALGAVFLGYGLKGLGDRADRKWAWKLFIVSLIYLTLLFGAIVADKLFFG